MKYPPLHQSMEDMFIQSRSGGDFYSSSAARYAVADPRLFPSRKRIRPTWRAKAVDTFSNHPQPTYTNDRIRNRTNKSGQSEDKSGTTRDQEKSQQRKMKNAENENKQAKGKIRAARSSIPLPAQHISVHNIISCRVSAA